MSTILLNLMLTSEESIQKLEVIFSEVSSSLEKFSNKIKQVSKSSKLLEDSLKALGDKAKFALQGLSSLDSMKEKLSANVEVANISNRIGAPSSAVNAWGNAIALSGSDVSQFHNSILALSDELNTLGGNSDVEKRFNSLGIATRNSAGQLVNILEILPQLANRMENMTPQQASSLGGQLGLDDGTIDLLMQGQGQVESLVEKQRELYPAIAENSLAFQEFSEAMTRANILISAIITEISTYILPVVTAAINLFSSLGEYLVQAFGIGKVALVIFSMLLFGKIGTILKIVRILRVALSGIFSGLLKAFPAIKNFFSNLGKLVSNFIEPLKKFFNWIGGFFKTKDSAKQPKNNSDKKQPKSSKERDDGMSGGATIWDDLEMDDLSDKKRKSKPRKDKPGNNWDIDLNTNFDTDLSIENNFGKCGCSDIGKALRDAMQQISISVEVTNLIAMGSNALPFAQASNSTITIGDIYVTSNASDPKEVASIAVTQIMEQFYATQDHFDDGESH